MAGVTNNNGKENDMSGNARQRRLQRRRHLRLGLRVPNTYRLLKDKVLVLGVAEKWAEYQAKPWYTRLLLWFTRWLRLRSS